jgi:tetratricopeptide (TPR) repeat protein
MVKGAIWRRQGKFRAAIEQFERAFLLNPRDAGLPYNIAYTYSILRDYALAERFCDKSISLAPDQCRAYIRKAQTYDLWRGDTKSALATLVSCPKQDDYGIRSACASQYVLERDYAAALARLAPILPMSGVGTAFAEAEEQMGSVFYMQAFVHYRLAVVHSLMREPDRALACYESARSILEKELEERPDDHHDHCILGLIHAGLGLRDDAIREGKMAVELLPVSKDAVMGVSMLEGLALIYVMVGEHDAALDHIEYLLSIPSDVSVASLRLNPRYDPLRKLPRFQKLLQQPDKVF